SSDSSTTTTAEASSPLDISKLNTYERYGLTVVPLFLGLLTVIALGLAAHSGDASPVYNQESPAKSQGGGIGFAPVAQSPAPAARHPQGVAGKGNSHWI
ncbi:MAG TPA: hypothetical protein PLD20_24460, partial [Blastocatellia bacterium]|nr:hypothetical protein [Blastocatellia bacterium]HMX27525.1 hypothetical protein [Blastocatellia bacterium]HMY73431.1 hypothetical protein [Blastocatellia bacterium]HMZ21109.1 hypothetical protein [Blastocatellia bacterium]HNG34081.1 hypothetical protein [Blastocatellia bacterium]